MTESRKKSSTKAIVDNYSTSIIEANLDPLFTIDIKGKISNINQAALNAIGKSRKEVLQTKFVKYFSDTKKAQFAIKTIIKKGLIASYPLEIIDGKLTPVLLSGSVYKDNEGAILGAVVIARDITEQKRIEKELTEAKILAEQAQTKAENALQSKQQFLSNMSHEIRTPMNAIIGFTKVVLKTDLSEKQKEYLNAIKLSGDTLIVLINDILDLAKVDSGKMEFESVPFKIKDSIVSMVNLFENRVQEKNLKFALIYDDAIPKIIAGDSVRLHQILINLLSNAIKFTSKGGIELNVKLLSKTSDSIKVLFSITDTGIGISEDKIDKIFENFQQANSSTSRLFGGTGLGLAIVKQLVEAQGGTIQVKSELLIGSTFSFELTFQKTNEQPEFEIDVLEIKSEIKNIKVLVVEDIALNQLLMKTLLDDFGFERDIAPNGKIAIEMLKEKKYDIVLMDLQMPEMNGFEATEYIRKTMKSDIPILALTADVSTVDVEKCKAVGMNDYIAKPVDEKNLYSKMIGLVIKNAPPSPIHSENVKNKSIKLTNLNFLIVKTKNNVDLLKEMITAYLEQTPPLILSMKQSFKDKNWVALQAAAHKMIPSFSIIGMSNEYEMMAKKIQDYATMQEQAEDIEVLIQQLENACNQACTELIEEFERLKKEINE